MEKKEMIQEVAAEAAVVANNVEGAAVPATSEEPKAEKAASLLEVALGNDRKEQCKLFGRHFSSTTKVEVVKKGAEAFLQSVATWQQNLTDLLKEIQQQASANFLQGVADSAENLSAEEIQQVIKQLQAKVAVKTA